MTELQNINNGIYYIKEEDFNDFLIEICSMNCSVFILNINKKLKKIMCYAKYEHNTAIC